MTSTSKKSSDTSSCSCLSEDADFVDFSKAEELLEDIRLDLKDVHNQLHLDLVKISPDQTSRSCKMNTVTVKLEDIDSRLLQIHNLVTSEPQDQDELVSNFGMSLKVDTARDKLDAIKKKHENLRKEWYSQDEHLNRMAAQVDVKETELKLQSVFCTTQGFILSKMLWKSSKLDSLLDTMVTHEKLALELIKTLDGCLYAFTQTFRDEMPEPSADEYQYVLCLCGILSNLAAVPDGRFLLISQSVCRDVYDQIIKILPNIIVPKAEDLKWLMLTAIYNVMICKEGEQYAKNNRYLLESLGECITPPHSNKIIILALKIISNLTNEIPNKAYMKHVSSFLPVRRLEELQQSKDSVTIRKQAKLILSSIMRLNDYLSSLGTEKLIGTTPLDESKSCQAACTQTCNKQNQELLAYYVFTDPNRTKAEESSSSEQTSVQETSESSTSTTSIETESTQMEFSNSFPFPRFHHQVSTRSAPVSSHRTKRDDKSRTQTPVSEYSSSRQFVDGDSSSLITPLPSTSQKCVTINFPVNDKFEKDPPSSLCRPSTLSMPTQNLYVPSKEPTASVSEEIQNIQYHMPQINLNKFFSITIGDNIQNSNCNGRNVGTIYPDGHNGPSIVTVFQISNSKALMPSDNSFAPFYSTISTNTSFPWETRMEGFFALKNVSVETSPAIINRQFTTPQVSEPMDECTDDTFDVAYGGYGACYEKLLLCENQTSPSMPTDFQNFNTDYVYDNCDLPSTSTGYYGYVQSFTPFTPIQNANVSSSTSLILEPEKEISVMEIKISELQIIEPEKEDFSNTKVFRDNFEPEKGSPTNSSTTKSSQDCMAIRKARKAQRGPFYRIFGRSRKR